MQTQRRATPQRLALLVELITERPPGHQSIAELHRRVRIGGRLTGYSTVFRAVTSLAGADLLERMAAARRDCRPGETPARPPQSGAATPTVRDALAAPVRDTSAVTTRTLLAAWLASAPFEREAVRGVYFRHQSVADVARLHAVSTADVGRALRTMYRRVASFVLDEQVDTAVPAPARMTGHVQTLARLTVASWRWDTAGDTMTWSDAMYELYGYPVGAVSATIDRHMSHKEFDDRFTVVGLIVAGATESSPVVFSQRIVRTDGTSNRVIMRVVREPGAREVLTGRAVVEV